MIGMLQGTVHAGGVVLTAGGVGYATRHCGVVAHSPGDEVTLLVTSVTNRDGETTLWSFDSPDEQSVFAALTSVPRVGPSAARSILRELGAGGVVAAVQESRADAISAVKGVGKKTAEAIVATMKVPDGISPVDVPDAPTQVSEQVVARVVALGFERGAVEEALGRVAGRRDDIAGLTQVLLSELMKGAA